MHVGDALRARGIACRGGDRRDAADRARRTASPTFKAGTVRCLVNVNVLTTGFDAPRIDLLAMLRPTLSTGLYVQMVGRGTRKADGKVNCLILDFAGNCRRHGPVDQVDIKLGGSNGAAVAPATVRTKTCPDCAEINPLDAAACCCCGYEWPKPKPVAKHATSADAVPILTGERVWLPVTRRQLPPPSQVWRSRRAAVVPGRLSVRPLALRRIRFASSARATRAPAPSAGGSRWAGSAPVPATVDEALQRQHELDPVVAIAVTRNGRFWNVIDRRVRRPDGSVVEVDRHYRCWVIETRADAARALAATPINDAILF